MAAARFASLLVLALAACGPPPPACEQVPSYDECAKLEHCSAVRLIVGEGHSGPIWRCEPKKR